MTVAEASWAVEFVRRKTARATLSRTAPTGAFVGYASTFETEPDLQGDVVDRQAFDGTLIRWRERGVWPPLLWQHERSVSASMGVITNLYTDDRGLVIEGRLDLDHEPAAALHEAMKSGRITSFSISYAVLDEKARGDGVNILLDLELIEISICATPANANAQLVGVKNSTSATNATVTWTTDENDPAVWMERIEQAAHGRSRVDPAVVKQVDDLILATKLELIQESIDRAEQATWEERLLTMVRDPVPVRVDAKMRPDR